VIGGPYLMPAVVALMVGYFQLAQLLSRNGPSVEPRDFATCDHRCIGQLIMAIPRRCRLYSTARRISIPRTDIDRTPLHETGGQNTGANGLAVVRFMLEHSVNTNVRMQGTTPLHLSSNYGRSDVARLLIEHGAQIEVKDSRCWVTPQLASAEGLDVVNLLLEYGHS